MPLQMQVQFSKITSSKRGELKLPLLTPCLRACNVLVKLMPVCIQAHIFPSSEISKDNA